MRAPTIDRLNEVRTQLRRYLPHGGRTALVLAPTSAIEPTQEVRRRIGQILGEHVTILTSTGLARDVRQRLLRRAAVDDRDPYFVEPALEWEGTEVPSAVQALTTYFNDQTPGGRVAVLLGPAGAGKSTLTEEVCGSLQATPQASSLTIRVSDKEWVALERQHVDVTPDNMLRVALRKYGFASDDLGQLDVLLANGALALVFDSFDEVCTRGPITSPNKLLERILGLASVAHSQARILITSRPEFWESVDPDLRQQYETLTLLPFDAERVEALFYLRFKDNPNHQKRARIALERLESPALRCIPLIVRSICEAIAEGGEAGAWLSATDAGIKHSDPLPGVARMICEREREKHHWPTHADDQFELFARLAAEFGTTYTAEEIIDCAVLDIHMAEEDAAKVPRHALLKRVDDKYTFRSAELARTIIADWLAPQLLKLATPTPDSQLTNTVGKLLSRDGEYRNLSQRTGARLSAERLSIEAGGTLWHHRTLLRRHDGAQSGLLRTLVDAFPPDKTGYRTLPFLPMEMGFLTATEFTYSGTVTNLDLSNIRVVNAYFRDVEISSCRFSQLTEFKECSFVRCTIGRLCDGLQPSAFMRSNVDDDTIGQSKRWIVFPDVRAEDIAKIALQRVMFRLLRAAGALAENAPSAFSLGTNLTEDNIEEHALDVLMGLSIVDRTVLVIGKVYERDAQKFVNRGEITGRLQSAYKEMAGWTGRALVH